MPRHTLKRSNKAKNKTRSRKQCGGGGGYFGYDEKEDAKHFKQFYRDLGLGYRGAANHEKVKETLQKLKKNWFKKYDINNDTELRDKLRRKNYI